MKHRMMANIMLNGKTIILGQVCIVQHDVYINYDYFNFFSNYFFNTVLLAAFYSFTSITELFLEVSKVLHQEFETLFLIEVIQQIVPPQII